LKIGPLINSEVKDKSAYLLTSKTRVYCPPSRTLAYIHTYTVHSTHIRAHTYVHTQPT